MISIIVIAVLAICMSVMVFLSYRQGIKDGQAIKESKPLPKMIEQHTAPIETPKEIVRLNTIAQNIDNYNGTSLGQRGFK